MSHTVKDLKQNPVQKPEHAQNVVDLDRFAKLATPHLGQFATVRPCRTCRGEGQIIDTPCTECHGKGIVKHKSTIHIKIPPGVEDGSRLTCSR